MPPGPRAHRTLFISTASVLAGGGVALAGSLLLRVLMARALEPGALGLVSQASAHGYLPTASAACARGEGAAAALLLTAGVGTVASAVALLAVFRNPETRRAALPSGGPVDVEASSL